MSHNVCYRYVKRDSSRFSFTPSRRTFNFKVENATGEFYCSVMSYGSRCRYCLLPWGGCSVLSLPFPDFKSLVDDLIDKLRRRDLFVIAGHLSISSARDHLYYLGKTYGWEI